MSGLGLRGVRFLGLALAAAALSGAPMRAAHREGAILAQEPGASPAGRGESETAERYRKKAEKSNRPEDWYNYGTALLREGRLAEAREPLRQASEAKKPQVEWFGQYNYGLARARTGHSDREPPRARREELLAARDAFREVLREAPTDEDARWNLELVDRWLEQPPQSGGGGSNGGGSSPPSGGAGSGESAGDAQGGERRRLTPEEASAMLERAGRAESAIRNRILGRRRFRDPVVDRNW
ncbi:MAG: hypothetical protein ACE5HQ_08070 [Gemmatimonadota bacterium]